MEEINGSALRTVGLAAATMIGYRRFVRPWQERWGASDDEVCAHLPGDDLISSPAAQITRAISIDAPSDDVWPWIVQIGADRGGFYSYDCLEDAVGLGIHSASAVVPAWQSRAVGDLVYADAKGTGGWQVMDVRPTRALVLKMTDVKKDRPMSCNQGDPWEFSWAFVLDQDGEGNTRLLVRERVAFKNRLVRFILSPMGFVSFVMTQKMMRGIKERAESCAGPVIEREGRTYSVGRQGIEP